MRVGLGSHHGRRQKNSVSICLRQIFHCFRESVKERHIILSRQIRQNAVIDNHAFRHDFTGGGETAILNQNSAVTHSFFKMPVCHLLQNNGVTFHLRIEVRHVI